MNQSKKIQKRKFNDDDIKNAVESIYDDPQFTETTDLVSWLQIKLQVPLSEKLDLTTIALAKQYLSEDYRVTHNLILTIVQNYNTVIAITKGKEDDLSADFRKTIDGKNEVPNEILNALFHALYVFYAKAKVPQSELNDIKKLSIANPIQPSKLKKTFDTIFCCGRNNKYNVQQKIFMSNVKEIAKLAMNASSNNLSTISEIPTNNDESARNFVGSFKPGSLLRNILLNTNKDSFGGDFLQNLNGEQEQAQLMDDSESSYCEYIGKQQTQQTDNQQITQRS